MDNHLYVTNDGKIFSDSTFDDDKIKTSIGRFFKSLNRHIKSTSFHYDENADVISAHNDVEVTKESATTYAIRYKKQNKCFRIDVLDDVLYFPILKKRLDELVLKTEENAHKVFLVCNGIQDTLNIKDLKIYCKTLKQFKRKLVFSFALSIFGLLILPLSIIPLVFIPDTSPLFFISGLWLIFSYLITHSFLEALMSSPHDYFSSFRYCKAIGRKIKNAKKLLKNLEKGITPSLEDNEKITNKNDDVSVYERMVVKASRLTCRTLENVSNDTGIEMLNHLKAIIAEYNAKKQDTPKFATRVKKDAYESKIAMAAIDRIQALNDCISTLPGQSNENISEPSTCSELSEFIDLSLGKIETPQENGNKVLSRGLGNGTSR